MTISVNPPPLQVPNAFLGDKQSSAFFSSLLNTIYQLWAAVYSMQYSAKVTTTDATATALVRSPISDGTTSMLECKIVAHRTGGSSGSEGDSAFYVLTGAYKNVGGVLTGVGTTSLVGGEDQTGWDVSLTSSGTDAVVVVTGAANNNITWQGVLSVYQVGS